MPLLERRADPLRCIVVMPFDPSYDRHYELISSALAVGYEVARIDQVDDGFGVIQKTFRKIASCDVVIGDLSGASPNVLYEIGIAHALRRPTLLIADSLDELPFDLAGFPVLRVPPSDATEWPGLKRAVDAARTSVQRTPVEEALGSYSVTFDQPLFGRRALALVIDGFCAMLLLTSGLLPLLGVDITAMQGVNDDRLPDARFMLGAAAVGWLWFALPTWWFGRTFGKALMRLRVVGVEGGGVGLVRATIRWLMSLLSIFSLGLGPLAALFPPNYQALHDTVSKTRVVAGRGPGYATAIGEPLHRALAMASETIAWLMVLGVVGGFIWIATQT